MPVSLRHNPASPSCNSCGSKDDLMDLTVGRYPNSGQTTVLCRTCRKRLLEILDNQEAEQRMENIKVQTESNRR